MARDNPELLPGSVIDGRVRLLRLVGRGGMGDVWAAEHVRLGNQVAVKLLSREMASNDEAVNRFSREAQAAAKIKSPHVVEIYDHGVHEGTPYIVMELLEGESLAARLSRERVLGPAEALSIVSQACRALGPAHALGIVHRDLKPGNLFLARSGHEKIVKVLDFGIVKLLGATALTVTGSTIGSPSYMSPEQVTASRGLDQRSDLFSLAVVAYRMLTGKLPFRGDRPLDTMLAITEGQFIMPSQHRPELPRALDVWFSRALAVDPAKRYQTAEELADTLALALQPDSVPGFSATLVSSPPHSQSPTLASRTEVAGFVPVAVPQPSYPPSAQHWAQAAPAIPAKSGLRASSVILLTLALAVAFGLVGGAAVAIAWFFTQDQSSAAAPQPSAAPAPAPAATITPSVTSAPEARPEPSAAEPAIKPSPKPSVKPSATSTATAPKSKPDFGF